MIGFFTTNLGILFSAFFLLVSIITFVLSFSISKKKDYNVGLSCNFFLNHADIKKIREDEAQSEDGNIPLSIKDYDHIVSSGIELRNEDHIELVCDNYEI